MINSSQTDKALPVKTSKPNFVTFFRYFRNSSFDYCEISLFVNAENQRAILLVTYASLASSRSEELEVNQWIALNIQRLSSQSEHAKITIHCFSIIILNIVICVCCGSILSLVQIFFSFVFGYGNVWWWHDNKFEKKRKENLNQW